MAVRQGGKKGKGKKAAAEPEEPEVPIRTIGFFATINMARQGMVPLVDVELRFLCSLKEDCTAL